MNEKHTTIIYSPIHARDYQEPAVRAQLVADLETESGRVAVLSTDQENRLIIDLIEKNDQT